MPPEEELRITLARIDERTIHIEGWVKDLGKKMDMTPTRTEFEALKEAIDSCVSIEEFLPVKHDLSKCVTKDTFDPIQRLAYSLVAAVLLAIIAAGMALLLQH